MGSGTAAGISSIVLASRDVVFMIVVVLPSLGGMIFSGDGVLEGLLGGEEDFDDGRVLAGDPAFGGDGDFAGEAGLGDGLFLATDDFVGLVADFALAEDGCVFASLSSFVLNALLGSSLIGLDDFVGDVALVLESLRIDDFMSVLLVEADMDVFNDLSVLDEAVVLVDALAVLAPLPGLVEVFLVAGGFRRSLPVHDANLRNRKSLTFSRPSAILCCGALPGKRILTIFSELS